MLFKLNKIIIGNKNSFLNIKKSNYISKTRIQHHQYYFMIYFICFVVKFLL